MPVKISVEVQGIKEVQRNLEAVAKNLHGTPMINAMRDATLYIDRDAKKNAPVDTGRLRASITPEVTSEGETVRGVVGSNVTYAPYVEFNEKAHHTIVKAHYLQSAFDDNKDKVEKRIGQAVEAIVKQANQ